MQRTMSGGEWRCERLGIALTDEQRDAFRYLELFGFRFCVDFGYDNAVEMAREHWENEMPVEGLH